MEFNFLTSFLIWLAASWGLTSILVQSRLFSRIRDWFVIYYPTIGYMLECYQCMGFWIGGGLSTQMGLNALNIVTLVVFTPEITGFILWGIISSGLIFIIRNLISKTSE
jgi:hypothetical protein